MNIKRAIKSKPKKLPQPGFGVRCADCGKLCAVPCVSPKDNRMYCRRCIERHR